eukprot:1749756-Prymnesium_polylepis.2
MHNRESSICRVTSVVGQIEKYLASFHRALLSCLPREASPPPGTPGARPRARTTAPHRMYGLRLPYAHTVTQSYRNRATG